MVGRLPLGGLLLVGLLLVGRLLLVLGLRVLALLPCNKGICLVLTNITLMSTLVYFKIFYIKIKFFVH